MGEERKKRFGCFGYFGIFVIVVIILGVFAFYRIFFVPRNVVRSFLKYVSQLDYQRASYYLASDTKIGQLDLEMLAKGLSKGKWRLRIHSINIANSRAKIEGVIIRGEERVEVSFFLKFEKGRWRIVDFDIPPLKVPEGVI